jgi:hypothetical protein
MRDHSGGPKINFRGGRIDAKQAGPAGVPEPQDSLQSHTATFARTGFSATEMIQLVACGHTLGGVQSTLVVSRSASLSWIAESSVSAFPNIIPNSSVTEANPDGQAPFDSTSAAYDNRV